MMTVKFGDSMTDNRDFFEVLVKKGIQIKKDLPMRDYTTFKIGGAADFGVFPKTAEEFGEVSLLAKEYGITTFVAGNGSNLLVSDNGFRGAVIFTTAMDGIRFEEGGVYAMAGVSMTRRSRLAAEKGLSGLEFAYGIPGTVGGAVYMNAGAYGSEMKNVVLFSDYWSEEGCGRLTGDEQCFGYRESAYMGTSRAVLGCMIALHDGNPDEIMAYCKELMTRRRDKQPLEYPSAGSAFKRYPGRFTAQMIDEAGLKGFSVGGAEVSVKHAGFIINRGGATAEDVRHLVSEIKDIIYKREGIHIESEMRYLSEKGACEI